MRIYHYSKRTNEYLRESIARLDPLETEKQGKDIFLIPAQATSIAPPPVLRDEVTIFNEGIWNTVPDFRGTIYWLSDGTKIEIADINVIVPPEGLLVKPTIPPTEDELNKAKVDKEIRDSAIATLKGRGELPPDYTERIAAVREA